MASFTVMVSGDWWTGWILEYCAIGLSWVGLLLLVSWLLYRGWTTLRWYQVRPLEILLAIALATLELGLLLRLRRVMNQRGEDRIVTLTLLAVMVALCIGGGAAYGWRRAWIRGETRQGERIVLLLQGWLMTGIVVLLVGACLGS